MTVPHIAARFCGPPGTANGGYLAGGLDRAMSVRLNAPIPLATDLQVLERQDGRRELMHGGKVLASAQPAELELQVPAAPGFAAAERASRRFVAFGRHAYPGCLVCGDARGSGDGLRNFAGATDDGAMVAAPWVPDATIAERAGRIPYELLWAAIDCPGYFAARDDGRSMLLGEITGCVDAGVHVGEPCMVIGWRERVDGRKHHVGTALINADGAVCARARALWIAPRQAGTTA
jgi:hypothetical protein